MIRNRRFLHITVFVCLAFGHATSALGQGSCPAVFSPAPNSTRPSWLRQLLNFDPVSDEQRVKAIWRAFVAPIRGMLVLDVENSILKELNDQPLLSENGRPYAPDRDLATQLTNLHKQILLRHVQGIADAHSENVQIEIYSDFKSLRFIVIPNRIWRATRVPESFLGELNAAYLNANEEFAQTVASLGIESMIDPRLWFKAGLDHDPNEANWNARLARYLSSPTGIVRSTNDQAHRLKADLHQQLQRLLAQLNRFPVDSPLLTTVQGIRIPGVRVFDLIKKSKNDPSKLIDSLRYANPNKPITDEQVLLLLKFAGLVDRLQPSIWQTTREVASLADAELGGLVIDAIGMGASNAYQTALQAALSPTLNFLTRWIREGEREVTTEFRNRMQTIRDVAIRTCKSLGGKCVVLISGDDTIVLPVGSALTSDGARTVLAEVDRAIGAARIRLAEVQPGIAQPTDRGTLGQQGERIEKILRDEILAHSTFAPKLPGLTFGISIHSVVPGEGEVELHVTGTALASLNASERQMLGHSFTQAIATFNDRNQANYSVRSSF